MASLDLGTLLIRIEADAKQALQEMQNVGSESQKQAEKASGSWKEAGESLTKVGKTLSVAITVPLTAAMAACVKLASDLTETLGKTEVVFGEMTDAVMDWSDTSVESMGLAQETALNMASSFGDMATSMGLSRGEAASMSMQLVQLAADMASFKNISIDRANVALQAVFTGETESLKAMGIVMTEANLEAFAMNEGLEETYSKMSQTEKVMLRYRYVMSQTTNAQGDFVRTGDSLANQSRKLGENIKQLGASFGKILEPAVTSVIQSLNGFVSWINNLDESTKRTILTIAEVAAVIPVVVLAVGTIIKAIDALKVSLTTLMANPVALWIAGIAAAVAAAGIIIANVKASIDEYNKSVSDMKDKATTVTTSYQSLIEVSQKENMTIDDVIEVINTAITTAEAAGEFVASVSTVEDRDRSVASVLDAIDAAIKAREMYCEVRGILPQDDPTWRELNEYRDGLIGGTITIYGEDGNDTLAALGTAIEGVSADLVALKAYEENAIQPRVTVEAMDSKERLATIESACKRILDYENLDVYFTAHVDDTIESLGLASESIQTLVDLNANWGEGVKSLVADMEAVGKAAKEALAQQAVVAMIDYVSTATQLGATQEEMMAGIQSIREQYTLLSGEIDLNTTNMTSLINTLNDGKVANDPAAILEFILAMITQKDTVSEDKSALEEFAEAGASVQAQQESGIGTTETMTASLELQGQKAGEMADTLQNDVTAAYTRFTDSVEAAKESEKEQIDQVEDVIASKQTEMDAMSAWSGELQMYYDNAETALTSYKEKYPELYDMLLAHYGNEQALLNSNSAIVIDETIRLGDELYSLEANKNDQIENIRAAANQTRLNAEQQFGSDIASLTSGLNVKELEAVRIQMTELGLTEEVGNVARLIELESYCRSAETLVSSNTFNMLALNEQYITDVENLDDDAFSAGRVVGDEMGEGMYNGLSAWMKPLADKAAEMMRNTIRAARKEQDSASPSKKTRDLIGKPFAQGIEVGIEEEMPNVLKTVKGSMATIISGGQSMTNIPSRIAHAGGGGNSYRGNTTVNQTNNFTSRTLTPYEQQQQVRKLNKDLVGVFG